MIQVKLKMGRAGFVTLVLSSVACLSVAAGLVVASNLFTSFHIRRHVEAKNKDIGEYSAEVLAWNSYFRNQCDPMALPATEVLPASIPSVKIPTPSLTTLRYQFDYMGGTNSYCGKADKVGSTKNRVCLQGNRPPSLGTLDETYGLNGVSSVTTGPVTNWGESTGVVIQPDGKILAVGITDWQIADKSGVLARFNVDGSLDSTFANNGLYISPLSPEVLMEMYLGVSLQADGKIVVLGFFGTPSIWKIELLRFMPDGTLDPSFGGGPPIGGLDSTGRVIVDTASVIPGEIDYVEKIIFQTDGKIVILGSHRSGSGLERYRLMAIRLNPDGSFDDSYGTGGVSVFGERSGAFASLRWGTVDPSDTVIALGVYYGEDGWQTILTKIDQNGNPITSFGDNAILDITPLPTQYSQMKFMPTGMALQPDGKVIISGTLSLAGMRYYLTAERRNSDGTRDSCFGVDGLSVMSFTCSVQTEGRGMLLRNNGAIDLVGIITRPNTGSSPIYDLAVARLTQNGAFDPTFGNGNGQEIIRMQPGIAPKFATLQDDGKVVVVGDNIDMNLPYTIFTMRFVP